MFLYGRLSLDDTGAWIIQFLVIIAHMIHSIIPIILMVGDDILCWVSTKNGFIFFQMQLIFVYVRV